MAPGGGKLVETVAPAATVQKLIPLADGAHGRQLAAVMASHGDILTRVDSKSKCCDKLCDSFAAARHRRFGQALGPNHTRISTGSRGPARLDACNRDIAPASSPVRAFTARAPAANPPPRSHQPRRTAATPAFPHRRYPRRRRFPRRPSQQVCVGASLPASVSSPDLFAAFRTGSLSLPMRSSRVR